MYAILISAAIGYLLGSIPFGYVLVRVFRGADVRTTGSGNIGATNVARTSPALGIVTLILDALKGAAAVAVAVRVGHLTGWADYHAWTPFSAGVYARAAIAALFAILGHIFPVWLRFRGGKGVATALGAFLLLAPQAMLAALGVFVLMVLVSRYISLSSVTAAAVFPLFVWVLDREDFAGKALIAVCLSSGLIIARHHQNIGRLVSGTEPRFQMRRT